jgi:mercuric ion transport protein
MALASFGVGTAWLAGVALFAASHRPVFLGMAAVGLIGGGGLLGKYRLRVPVALRWLTAAGLLVGVVLLYYGFTYA